MTTDIAVSNPGLPASVEAAQELAREYIAAAKSEATLKAYAADWADFMAWAEAAGLSFLPATPGTVAVYASTVSESLKTSTITRRLASISQAHQAAGHDSATSHPAVREVMKGIRRVKGAAQDAKAALVTEDIREMVETLPDNLKGARDRALLLLGFAGAFRRSELVGLDVADMEFVKEGVRVTIRRSKTDQEGEGRVVGIPFGSRIETCPVRSLEAWGEASQIETGPVFRPINRHGQIQPGRLSGAAVAQVVKSAAGAAGLDPTKYAGHSLRAGLATAAAAAGVAASAIQAQTGHKSLAMLHRYIRPASVFRDNAAAQIGL